MSILTKTILETIACVAFIVLLYNAEKVVKFEQECVKILKTCKRNHIGFIELVRIIISATRMTRAERRHKKAKMKGEGIFLRQKK